MTSDPDLPSPPQQNTDKKLQELEEEKKALNADMQSFDEEIAKSMKQGRAGVRRKQQTKKIMRAGMFLVGGLVLYFLYGWLFTNKKGGMGYGLCKVFLELQIQYPPELRISYAEPLSKTMRIWYVEHDAFGQSRLNAMDCAYKQDEARGMILDKVLINRREVSPKAIERFNNSISAVMAYPPDLTYPLGLPDNIKELKLPQ